MANAFWGGFASSLKGRMDADYESELELKRQRALKELEKEYGREVIDSALTVIEGNEEVRYNKYGEPISRRPLSPQEIEIRDATTGKVKAEGRRALAEAGKSEAEAEYTPRRLALDERQAEASIASSRASAAAAMGGLDLRRQEMEHNISEKEQQKVDEAEQLIWAASQSDDASARSKAELFQAELAGALATGDKVRYNRLLNQIKGELSLSYLRAKTDASTQRGSFGSMPGSTPPIPGSN